MQPSLRPTSRPARLGECRPATAGIPDSLLGDLLCGRILADNAPAVWAWVTDHPVTTAAILAVAAVGHRGVVVAAPLGVAPPRRPRLLAGGHPTGRHQPRRDPEPVAAPRHRPGRAAPVGAAPGPARLGSPRHPRRDAMRAVGAARHQPDRRHPPRPTRLARRPPAPHHTAHARPPATLSPAPRWPPTAATCGRSSTTPAGRPGHHRSWGIGWARCMTGSPPPAAPAAPCCKSSSAAPPPAGSQRCAARQPNPRAGQARRSRSGAARLAATALSAASRAVLELVTPGPAHHRQHPTRSQPGIDRGRRRTRQTVARQSSPTAHTCSSPSTSPLPGRPEPPPAPPPPTSPPDSPSSDRT